MYLTGSETVTYFLRLRYHPAVPYMERVSLKSDILPLRYPIMTKSGEMTTQLPIGSNQVPPKRCLFLLASTYLSFLSDCGHTDSHHQS